MKVEQLAKEILGWFEDVTGYEVADLAEQGGGSEEWNFDAFVEFLKDSIAKLER